MNAQIRGFEPTDQDIADRAEYLRPLLAASVDDVGELLGTANGALRWDEFAQALQAGDSATVMSIGKELLAKAVAEEAETLASNELYRWIGSGANRQHFDERALERIKAQDVWAWMRERSL